MTDEALRMLAERLAQRLTEGGLRLAVAESCTGGWIAKVLTDLAGSSLWFERGFVTYSNAAKQELLGVPATLLQLDGAVSEAVVRAMAQGALTASPAEVALAVSGIAGPGGGSADKPVGTVWLAWARRAGEVSAQRAQFSGDREAVRRQTVALALEGLLARLDP
jgi:nicotinamide-nucleotide amidase